MGVAWVLSTNESLQNVEIALERAGAEHHGNFKVDCTVYRPQPAVQGQIGQFFLLHHSNFPDTACCIADPFSNPQNVEILPPRATSDLGFELIMQKFSASLLPDLQTRFEVNGSEYHLKDFRVRVGTAVMGTSTKGVVVEFEFAPCSVVFQCFNMLHELVTMFFGMEAKRLPLPLGRQRNSPENYYAVDTMEQYLYVFNELRKRAS